MLNQNVFIGRLTRDPERKDVGDKVVSNFSIAVDRSYGSDETDFIDCAVWGAQAENLVKYQKKGSLIAVVGRLQIDRPEPGKQYHKVNCQNIRYLEKANTNNNDSDW